MARKYFFDYIADPENVFKATVHVDTTTRKVSSISYESTPRYMSINQNAFSEIEVADARQQRIYSHR